MRFVISSQLSIGIILFCFLGLQKTDGKSEPKFSLRKDGSNNKLMYSGEMLQKQKPIVGNIKPQIKNKLTNKPKKLVRRIRSSQFGTMMIMSKPNTDDEVRPIKITGTMKPDVLFKSTGEESSVQILVERGAQPLIGAQVTLNIVAIGGSRQKYSITLRDNGVGADSLENDGFYSGNINENMIQEPEIYKIDAKISYENSTNDSADNSFERVHEVGSLTIKPKPPHVNVPPKIHPPGKISDLKAQIVDAKNQTVLLEWTAPGAESDRGTVAKYTIRAHSESKLGDPKNDSYGIEIITPNWTPKAPYEHEEVTIEVTRLTVANKTKALTADTFVVFFFVQPHGPTGLTAPMSLPMSVSFSQPRLPEGIKIPESLNIQTLPTPPPTLSPLPQSPSKPPGNKFEIWYTWLIPYIIVMSVLPILIYFIISRNLRRDHVKLYNENGIVIRYIKV